MHLKLTDAEAPALIALLKHAIDEDRYPLSERVQTWQGIPDKLEPCPARALALPRNIMATRCHHGASRWRMFA
jgi:hypothetical protein